MDLKGASWKNLINPVAPMGDQDRVSPYNINTILNSENKEKYQFGDNK